MIPGQLLIDRKISAEGSLPKEGHAAMSPSSVQFNLFPKMLVHQDGIVSE